MTTQTPEALPALIERLRLLPIDHAPDGWPAVRTREITALLDRITELEAQLAAIGAGGVEPLRKCLHQIAEPGCTRSHPHEAMSPECRIRAVIAEMRNREARGAEATEHCLGRFADVLERALADRAMQAQAAPAAVAGPVAYRVLRKRHDGEWVTDGRAWCDGVPTQDLVDDIALRSDGWRIEYAFAAPTTQAEPVAQEALDAAFEAVRHRLCELQRYSFVLDDDGVVRRVQDRTGNWIEFDDAHALFDPVAVDAARAQAKEGAIHE